MALLVSPDLLGACPIMKRSPYCQSARARLACVLLLMLASCKSRSSSQQKAPSKSAQETAQETAAERLDAVAPAPPDPGKVDFTVSGAINLEVHGVGPSCDAYPGQGMLIRATSENVLGPDVALKFVLYAMEARRGESLTRTIGFSQGERDFSVRPPGLTGEVFELSKDGLQLDLSLASEDGAARVKIKGSIVCGKTATENQVPEAIAALLGELSGAKVRPFSTRDFGREQDLRSVSVVVPATTAHSLILALRAKLGPGWVAFVGTNRWLGDEQPDGVEVVVGPGATQFDILRLAQSNAINYGMETEALIKKLSDYDKRYGIDIFHAETDTIEFRLRDKPGDLSAFAQDLYTFCPDLVDQGVGSIEALEESVDQSGQVSLWWD